MILDHPNTSMADPIDYTSQTASRITKVFHKNSRRRCQTCRTRRVKVGHERCAVTKVRLTASPYDDGKQCDELRPILVKCKARGVACAFTPTALAERTATNPRPSPAETASAVSGAQAAGVGSAQSDQASSLDLQLNFNNLENALDLSETKSRSMLVLRLMQNFQEHLSRPFPDHVNSHVVTAWGMEIPRMGLQHDNLLYMMFALLCFACFVASQKTLISLWRRTYTWVSHFASNIRRWLSSVA